MLFALALGNLTLCAALFFFDYGNKKPVSLSTWMVARQCQAAAWMLLFLRAIGIVPDLLSIPLGYCVLFAGVALEAGALWEAAGRAHWRRYLFPIMGAAVAVFFACFFIDEAGLRVVASSLVLGLFYLGVAAALACDWAQASMLRRFLAIASVPLALTIAARGVLVLAMPEGWGWISSTMVQMLSSGAYYVLMLFGGFGFLLLGRERLQAELARLAVQDPVTEVPNRRGFFNALTPWLALARRPGLPTGLIHVDLDHFKRVNDSYGHPAGDTVLRAVVETVGKQLRDSDLLGRLVGVEFAILLPRTSLDDSVMVAERIRAAIEATPVKSARALINLTVSLGVTTIRPDDSTTSLFKRADEALRMAKSAGRNRVVQAAPPEPLEAPEP